MTRPRDPYVALARAAKAGRGIRLSEQEVRELIYRDDAVVRVAWNCMTECTCDIQHAGEMCQVCFDAQEES